METTRDNAVGPEGGANFAQGTFLFPSRADLAYRMGHMWVYWVTSGGRKHRGYWPDWTHVPADVRRSNSYRDFFTENFVPGRCVDESLNVITVNMMVSFGDDIRSREWIVDDRAEMLLELKWGLKENQDGIDYGSYSCDESRKDCNNCSSWALEVMREVRGDPAFLPCERPKRLRHVELAIWGD
jgi:hypothetical protein